MDFFKLVQSLDELFFEVVSWLLFYPLTLWRMIRSPLATMKAAELELAQEEEQQFEQLISPPLFLLLTLILIHAVELGTIGESEIVTSTRGFSGLISNDTNLIIFRILMFSLLPLAAAVRLVHARGGRIDNEVIRTPFYVQCYVAAVLALLSEAPTVFAQEHYPFGGAGYATAMGLSLIWLFVVEARWFAAELDGSIGRGLGQAAILIVEWVAVLVLAALLLR